jgi:hypothetical protein
MAVARSLLLQARKRALCHWETPVQDRRKQIRRRTYLGGQIAYRQRYCAIDCLVRNLSRDGARLVFGGDPIIPAEFELIISQSGETRRGRLIWHKATEVGVQFVDQPLAALLSIDVTKKIKALREQNAALRRRLTELTEPPL